MSKSKQRKERLKKFGRENKKTLIRILVGLAIAASGGSLMYAPVLTTVMCESTGGCE